MYPFQSIEKKWQENWHDQQNFVVKAPKKKKAYILEMLPYPSGKIHMGHVRNYAIGDAIARFLTLQGFEVLHPMGWDAFGLPAENAALERGVHPSSWTYENIAEMKKQICSLGLSYDWTREITTCSPEYYGLEQKIFLDLYKKGLVYRKESWVNWDPVENTVLANEQVVGGKGWRSGATVERKQLTQWSVKITDYAEELLEDLKNLTGWPEKVLKMQENWIGRSQGAVVNFSTNDGTIIPVYTTRPETLFGASFIAIAPNHPLAEKLATQNSQLKDFIQDCQKHAVTEEAISTMDKKGFATGLWAENVLAKNQKLPIYIANFVLMEYGTGAIFGCPAHDERDFQFATLYNLPINPVIAGDSPLPNTTNTGTMINSNFLNGLSVDEAKEKIITFLENNRLGERKINYRLRDWLVSRQRYWGCPIPIVHCDSCGVVPVPLSELPIKLPEDVNFDQSGNPLERHPNWKHTNCPSCGKMAKRETDTLDTFFESSWYFLRYCCPNAVEPIEKSACEQWMAVDWYIGGIEHAVLHLLYARFFTKALRDCGYLNINEPFTNLLTQGMVCHHTFQDVNGNWLYPNEVQKNTEGHWVKIADKTTVTLGRNEKMSKSKRNLIDPQHIIDSYGADVARLFILSDTPPEKDFEWNEDGLDGAWRYLNRIWRLFQEKIIPHSSAKGDDEKLQKIAHQAVAKITLAYQTNALNKVIALCREFSNKIEELLPTCSSEVVKTAGSFLLKTLSPIVPHIAAELLLQLGTDKNADQWPVVNNDLAQVETVSIAVQINGKTKWIIEVDANLTKEQLIASIHTNSLIKQWLNNKEITKVIAVPNKIVNFVIA